MTSISIGNRKVSRNHPYIIAEIGVNHGNSLFLAKQLIELAKEGGAHAAKFQTYKAELLTCRDSPAYWDTSKETCRNQYDLFKQHDAFGPKEYEVLAAYCTQLDIDFISTPFDNGAVDYLAPMVPCFKIASADITNLPLLRRVANHGKPVLLSTGAADFSEIDWAVQILRTSGAPSIVLLHCVLNYPTQYRDAHLAAIYGLVNRYPSCLIGYSDHTLPDPQMISLTSAFLLGACVIEKHFTHDRLLPGNDHYHAMDVNNLKCFVAGIASIQTLLGETSEKSWLPIEEAARRNARRSLVLTTDLAAGTLLDDNCLVCKRPAFGISPVYYDQVIGRRTRRDLPRDYILQWADLD